MLRALGELALGHTKALWSSVPNLCTIQDSRTTASPWPSQLFGQIFKPGAVTGVFTVP